MTLPDGVCWRAHTVFWGDTPTPPTPGAKALVLSKGAVDDWRGLAMALIETNDANVAPAVKEAFEEVLLQEPADPLALYFLGHAAMSDGDTTRARELWTALRTQLPDEAPLAAELGCALG